MTTTRFSKRGFIIIPIVAWLFCLSSTIVVRETGARLMSVIPSKRRRFTSKNVPSFLPEITIYTEEESSTERQVFQKRAFVKGQKKEKPSSDRSPIHTDVRDLAVDFEEAVSALKDQKDIHVGKLLAACERLESTMKKIGFTQGAKDIGGNIGKIRELYNQAPPSKRDSMSELLKYELETGVHGNDAKNIRDPSAAMGFLWLGRTLNYQNDMFRLMLDQNEEPYEAAKHAYDRDLKPHHSWAVQKVCQAAMGSLKPLKRTSILSSLGGFEEERFGTLEREATSNDMHQMMNVWQPLLSQWKKTFNDLELGSI